jgi:hypothetical protein
MVLGLAACANDDGSGKNIEWLFVQNAEAVTLEDGLLTLSGISSTTLFFSDRPDKIAAYGLTSEFVTFWSTGGGSDNFEKSPPNAALAIASEDGAEDVVVTLTNPRLNGDTLQYDVTLIEGPATVAGGPCSLFVDVIGMPLSPVSVAGTSRRVARRTVRRVAY